LKRYVQIAEVKFVPENEIDIFTLGMVYRRTFDSKKGWCSAVSNGSTITDLTISADRLRDLFGVGADAALWELAERILIDT
jgi:hypothetical protein